MFRWLHAILLKFNSADLVWRQLSDLAKKINSNLHPVFTSKKLLLRSKWENANHLLLMNNALFMNTNGICVMQVVWAIDANISALMNISILSFMGHTQSEEQRSVCPIYNPQEVMSEAGLFNLWNVPHWKQKLTLNNKSGCIKAKVFIWQFQHTMLGILYYNFSLINHMLWDLHTYISLYHEVT